MGNLASTSICEDRGNNPIIKDCTSANHVTTVVSSYVQGNFPLIDSATQYTPFQLGRFLNQHVDTYIDGVKISNKKIINYLTAAKLIPVSQTTAYKVDHLCSLGCIPENASWTDLSKHGRKALLTPQETMWLIRDIRSDSRGGESMGVSELKDRLRKQIVNVWTQKKIAFATIRDSRKIDYGIGE